MNKLLLDSLNSMSYFILRQIAGLESLSAYEELEAWIAAFDEAFKSPVAEEALLLEDFVKSLERELLEGSYLEVMTGKEFLEELKRFIDEAEAVFLESENSRFYNIVKEIIENR